MFSKQKKYTWEVAGFFYRAGLDCADDLLLPSAEERPPLDCQDDLRVQVPDGLHRHLGYDRLVHEGEPAFLDLRQGEVAGELDSAVDGGEIVGLEGNEKHYSPRGQTGFCYEDDQGQEKKGNCWVGIDSRHLGIAPRAYQNIFPLYVSTGVLYSSTKAGNHMVLCVLKSKNMVQCDSQKVKNFIRFFQGRPLYLTPFLLLVAMIFSTTQHVFCPSAAEEIRAERTNEPPR